MCCSRNALKRTAKTFSVFLGLASLQPLHLSIVSKFRKGWQKPGYECGVGAGWGLACGKAGAVVGKQKNSLHQRVYTEIHVPFSVKRSCMEPKSRQELTDPPWSAYFNCQHKVWKVQGASGPKKSCPPRFRNWSTMSCVIGASSLDWKSEE